MATKEFEHIGKVLSIKDGILRVGFTAQSACSSCQARSKCGMSESSEREISIKIDKSESYNIGDEVTIAVSYAMGDKAVFLAYIVPLIILMATLVATIVAGVNEGVAALTSLGVMALYFVGVYVLRDKIEKKIIFRITK